MPPKARLHKTTGKSSISHCKTIENSEPSSSIGISPEIQQQFEIELCWCIQQLQTALKSGKLNNKQVQDHTKALNTLMNNNAPMIQKRQVMRISFGDYRAKMAAEDKKVSRNVTNIKLVPGTPSKNSVFVKKSAFSSTGNDFRFNFQAPKDNGIVDEINNVKSENYSNGCNKVESENYKSNHMQFTPSNNSFKFNFNVEMES